MAEQKKSEIIRGSTKEQPDERLAEFARQVSEILSRWPFWGGC